VTKGFASKFIVALEPSVTAVARELIDTIVARGECEFVTEFAEILPIHIFLTLIGVPVEDRRMLRALGSQLTRPDGSMTPEQLRDAADDYLRPYILARLECPWRRSLQPHPRGADRGRPWSLDEAQRMCRNLLFGGLDTVVANVGFIALHLARYPEDWRRLREDPALIPAAADEFLRRYASTSVSRNVIADFEAGWRDVEDRRHRLPGQHAPQSRPAQLRRPRDRAVRPQIERHPALRDGQRAAPLRRCDAGPHGDHRLPARMARKMPDYRTHPGPAREDEGRQRRCVHRAALAVADVTKHPAPSDRMTTMTATRRMFQEAYYVRSIDEAAKMGGRVWRGPFYMVRHHETEQFSYRGKDVEADVSYAFGYLGDTMIQFIEQHDDQPSIYRDMYAGRRGGFHHIAYLVSDFGAERQRWLDLGYELATELFADGVNAAYFDTRSFSGGFTRSTAIRRTSWGCSESGSAHTTRATIRRPRRSRSAIYAPTRSHRCCRSALPGAERDHGACPRTLVRNIRLRPLTPTPQAR
jgi:hypothetical protein